MPQFGRHARSSPKLKKHVRRVAVGSCPRLQDHEEFDDKDDIRLGDNFYIGFLYGSGDGREADKGVTYAAEDALSDDDFLMAIFLELATDHVEEMRRKIVAFGVKVLDVPDPHLYFQAPGGQVFRLVGINEDLSRYEGTG